MIISEHELGPLRVITSLDDLPRLPDRIDNLFADAETTSFNDRVAAFYPHQGHRACGWAFTWDDEPGAWYLPIRHRDESWNMPLVQALEFLRDLFKRSRRWTNHNVKFDAHFADVDDLPIPAELVCTVVRAKAVDSDRMNHQLKPLMREWLGIDTGEETRLKAYLGNVESRTKTGRRTRGTKDYGRAPADILGFYACMDVVGNRLLELWLQRNMPEEQEALWRQEVNLTSVLFRMERRGLPVDQDRLKIEEVLCLRGMIQACETVEDLTGVELVDSNACAKDIIVNQLGLPILGRTKTGNASFDADTMKLYAGHPAVLKDERALRVIGAIMRHRDEERFLSLFVNSFKEKMTDGLLFPSYNQVVRTGRMSCRDPNSQQMSKRARRLIKPRPGRKFICGDASQMEFRIIAHYTRDEDAIRAYQEDARTDYHQWVADMCSMARSPAKTMNFLMAYGGGKKKATAQLMGNPEILDVVSDEVDEMIRLGHLDDEKRIAKITEICRDRAEAVYERYHDTLPGIKVTSAMASSLCKRRGWIRNAYKRRRHLPGKAAHKAFNSMVQGCAMDVIKERMVAIDADPGPFDMLANVHDELLFECDIDVVDEHVDRLQLQLESNEMEFRVPFTWDMGESENNWAEAK